MKTIKFNMVDNFYERYVELYSYGYGIKLSKGQIQFLSILVSEIGYNYITEVEDGIVMSKLGISSISYKNYKYDLLKFGKFFERDKLGIRVIKDLCFADDEKERRVMILFNITKN